jgi:hypothetical protein
MKRALLISVMLLASVAGAHADYVDTMYYDLIRPHGHSRSEAIYQANPDACYSQTGASRTRADGQAFKKCMLVRGYRWQYTRLVRDSPPANEDTSSPPDNSPVDDSITANSIAVGQAAQDAANEQEVQYSIDASNAIAAAAAQSFQ